MSTTIAEQVTAMHVGRAQNDVWGTEQAALSGRSVTSAVALGAAFPDADLLDAENTPTSITQARGEQAAVVVFYRGAWCPYCNLALHTYQQQLAGPLAQRGVALIAVSPQTPDGSLAMTEKHDLEFPVLSDVGNRIAGALGILTRPSDESLATQLEHGLDLTKVNADGTAGLPMPTVAIVDQEGRLAWIDIHPDYSTRTEPQQILDALDEAEL